VRAFEMDDRSFRLGDRCRYVDGDIQLDFAILAPVPREHLDSALGVLKSQPYVAFGSQKWELFRMVEKLREGGEVPVLIYPSNEDDVVKLTYEVSWTAWYVGCTEDSNEKLADQNGGRRPPTTVKYYPNSDHANDWGVLWRVNRLHRLPAADSIPIRELDSYKTGYWRKNAPPRGPEIVARPSCK
jgi:hypothetical protein